MEQQANYRHIIRVADTDLKGEKQIVYALRRIKGVGTSFGHAVCSILHLDEARKVGSLTDEELRRVEEVVRNPAQFGLPSWVYNRRRDRDTGKDIHLCGNALAFSQESDIRMMKKIRCYKGVRHMLGQPVRGQRTRSNFRKNKGKVMGVKKPKVGKKQ
jgi:small subunit ribosomal protein S13